MERLAAYGEPVEGTPFGRYRLIELLGRGGMGEVWRAHDTATNNRTVAIKLLPPHLAQDDTFVHRFRREADAAARLNNPHIIPIHTYGEIDGRLYVDMRLIEGHDLEQVLADGPLDPITATTAPLSHNPVELLVLIPEVIRRVFRTSNGVVSLKGAGGAEGSGSSRRR